MVKKRKYKSKKRPRNRNISKSQKNKNKRKSRIMRLSRAGMRGEEAWARLVEQENRRTSAQFPGPGEPGTPAKLTIDEDYVDEVYLCKAHCDKIMNYSYNGGEGSVKCDLLNIKKAYQKKSGYRKSDVYDKKAEDGVMIGPCSVCENIKQDGSDKECVLIGNCRWCISDNCSRYLPLKNFRPCEVCSI